MIALGLTLAAATALPAAASANSSQIAILQDNSDLSNPAAAFAQFRELGANTVRVVDRLVAACSEPEREEEAELQRD